MVHTHSTALNKRGIVCRRVNLQKKMPQPGTPNVDLRSIVAVLNLKGFLSRSHDYMVKGAKSARAARKKRWICFIIFLIIIIIVVVVYVPVCCMCGAIMLTCSHTRSTASWSRCFTIR